MANFAFCLDTSKDPAVITTKQFALVIEAIRQRSSFDIQKLCDLRLVIASVEKNCFKLMRICFDWFSLLPNLKA